ncbi:hypothetical protein [Nocardia colli]|uniref:hypothetical protein n=1 Tax=Nocardia colli TaxID=2545717 RepID=UPI0035E38363
MGEQDAFSQQIQIRSPTVLTFQMLQFVDGAAEAIKGRLDAKLDGSRPIVDAPTRIGNLLQWCSFRSIVGFTSGLFRRIARVGLGEDRVHRLAGHHQPRQQLLGRLQLPAQLLDSPA